MTNLSDLYTESDLRRLAATEPNPVLQKSYRDKLDALRKSAAPGAADLAKAGTLTWKPRKDRKGRKSVGTKVVLDKDLPLDVVLTQTYEADDTWEVSVLNTKSGGSYWDVESPVTGLEAAKASAEGFLNKMRANLADYIKDAVEPEYLEGNQQVGTAFGRAAGSADLAKATAIDVGSKVQYRLFNKPEGKSYGDVQTAEVLELVDKNGEKMYRVRQPGGGTIDLHRREIIRVVKAGQAGDLRKYENTYCDGAGDGGNCSGEVRRLPFSNGNLNLCRAHFQKEMAWRVQQNQGGAKADPYDIPRWESLKVMADSKGEPVDKSARPALRKGDRNRPLTDAEADTVNEVLARYGVKVYGSKNTSGNATVFDVEGKPKDPTLVRDAVIEALGGDAAATFYPQELGMQGGASFRATIKVPAGQDADMMLAARPRLRKSDAVVVRGSLSITDAFNGLYIYGKSPEGEDVFVAQAGDGSDDDPMAAPDYDPNDEADTLAEAYGFTIVDKSARAGLRKGLISDAKKADGRLANAMTQLSFTDLNLSGNPALAGVQKKVSRARQLLVECRNEIAQVLKDEKSGRAAPAAAPAEEEAE